MKKFFSICFLVYLLSFSSFALGGGGAQGGDAGGEDPIKVSLSKTEQIENPKAYGWARIYGTQVFARVNHLPQDATLALYFEDDEGNQEAVGKQPLFYTFGPGEARFKAELEELLDPKWRKVIVYLVESERRVKVRELTEEHTKVMQPVLEGLIP